VVVFGQTHEVRVLDGQQIIHGGLPAHNSVRFLGPTDNKEETRRQTTWETAQTTARRDNDGVGPPKNAPNVHHDGDSTTPKVPRTSTTVFRRRGAQRQAPVVSEGAISEEDASENDEHPKYSVEADEIPFDEERVRARMKAALIYDPEQVCAS
jgi:hypothetical protein